MSRKKKNIEKHFKNQNFRISRLRTLRVHSAKAGGRYLKFFEFVIMLREEMGNFKN